MTQNMGMNVAQSSHDRKKLEDFTKYMSYGMRFPTMWYMQPAKPQISLRICAD